MATTSRLSAASLALGAVLLEVVMGGGAAISVCRELLIENPLLQIVLRIEQQAHPLFARLANVDGAHVAHFEKIGGGADRPLARIEHAQADPRAMRQNRPAPSARTERADRRQRQYIGV